jgi:hypothetical protein
MAMVVEEKKSKNVTVAKTTLQSILMVRVSRCYDAKRACHITHQ